MRFLHACVRSSVIYKFSCGDCNASYLGCTWKRCKTRIHQHLGTSERSGLALTNPSHSESRNYAKKFTHNISANNFRIVSTASPTDLNILETMHIHKKNFFKYPSTSNRAVHYHVWERERRRHFYPHSARSHPHVVTSHSCAYMRNFLSVSSSKVQNFVLAHPGCICRRNSLAISFFCLLSTWQHSSKKEEDKIIRKINISGKTLVPIE